MTDDALLSRAKALKEELVSVRRDIHRHPELAFKEHRTAEKAKALLEGMGLSVRHNIAGTTGLVATLDSGRPGPTLMIRAEMDALPITEETGTPYASENTGVMHACGHDAHLTCAVGAARLLSERRDALRGRVQIVLQPAEESPPGGAKVLIEEGGIMEGVDAALALHVHPGIPLGRMGFRPGAMLAFSDRFTVRIKGKGGHAARPHLTVDAVAVAVQVYQALQYLVSRENNPLQPFVVTVGCLQAGSAANVIPGEAILKGTVRTLEQEVHDGVAGRVERVVAGVCQATRAEYEFEYVDGYPSLVNDEAFTLKAAGSVESLLGKEGVTMLPTPEMGGEDFSFFARRVPATLFRLGVRNEARGVVHPVHSARFDLDEDALVLGSASLARITLDYLNGHKG